MALTPAEKQKRYREKQKKEGRKEVRAYLTPSAKECYEEISQESGWNDSTLVSNAIRLLYAANKCGQLQFLNNWLNKNGK